MTTPPTNQITTWTGCYEGGWQGLIVPEAFSHPAKFSYKLTERMFRHAISKGWISKGSVVVDPFGGVGTGGIIAAYNDMAWVGVELEQKFVELARENFELHRKKWDGLGSPQPLIMPGDSRKLCELIAEADIVISSPPYEGALDPKRGGQKHKPGCRQGETQRRQLGLEGYGSAENLGHKSHDTFWQAAKEIVQQCHQILKPGGHAIWVVKAFVRKGSRVDFPGDWRRLCESVGFRTVCTHHAMLVKETTGNGLFGEITEKKERKSFFRRLAESKGSPAIDFEVILCMEK